MTNIHFRTNWNLSDVCFLQLEEVPILYLFAKLLFEAKNFFTWLDFYGRKSSWYFARVLGWKDKNCLDRFLNSWFGLSSYIPKSIDL